MSKAETYVFDVEYINKNDKAMFEEIHQKATSERSAKLCLLVFFIYQGCHVFSITRKT